MTGENPQYQGPLCQRAPEIRHDLDLDDPLDSISRKRREAIEPNKQEKHSQATTAIVRRMVCYGGFVVRCLWFVSVVWSLNKAGSNHGFKNSKSIIPAIPVGPPVAGISVLPTRWPSPFFKPHALVCPKGRVFLADEFRVFELDKDSMQVTPFPCEVNGTIADIASDCDDTSCWPVVLLKGVPPKVYDCGEQLEEVMRQADTPAQRFSTRGQKTLYVAHGHRVIEYGWSRKRDGWVPHWDVVTLGAGGLDAMDVVKNRLLLFRTQDERTPGSGSSVELVSLDSGEPCGVWELPPALMGAGCAEENGANVLVLASGTDASSQVGVRGKGGVQLLNATLQASGQGGCPAADDGAAVAAAVVTDGKVAITTGPAANIPSAATATSAMAAASVATGGPATPVREAQAFRGTGLRVGSDGRRLRN